MEDHLVYPIIETKEIAGNVFLQRILAPLVARKRKAGQFLVLRLGEDGERIPLTIVGSDPVEGSVTVIFQAVGKSTTAFSRLSAGDAYTDVVGPLGKPTHIERFGTVVAVGGGIGAAPLLPIASAIKKAGNRLVTIMGARTKDLVILEDEMRAISDEIVVTTDDGSYAVKGFVTTALQEMIDRGVKIDLCIAIGPVVMMRAVADVTRRHRIRTVVSLNPIMVDATGMCGACRVTVGGTVKFACVDGPEFDGHLVDFKELVLRNRAYLKEERAAMERFEHAGGGCMGSGCMGSGAAGPSKDGDR